MSQFEDMFVVCMSVSSPSPSRSREAGASRQERNTFRACTDFFSPTSTTSTSHRHHHHSSIDIATMSSDQQIPSNLWKHDTPAPQLGHVLSQVAGLLNDLGYSKSVAALQKEATKAGLDKPDPATAATPLLDLYASKSATSTSEDSDSDSSDEDSDDESIRDEAEGVLVDVEAEETSDDDSDENSASSSDSESDEDSSDSSASSAAAAPTGTKRKRVLTPPSSDDSSSDSDLESDSSSSSDSDGRPSKRTKTKSSSSSSGSSSDSSSSSSSDSDSSEPDDSSSDDSSDSSSNSESESDSTPPPPKKTSKKTTKADKKKDKKAIKEEPAQAGAAPPVVQQGSESSVTLDGDEAAQDESGIHPDRLKRMPQLQQEPRSVDGKKKQVPFSRIPTDQYVDPRFGSNAYVSYDYADKAHQDLIVTRGKGFTKEKNKKKRGKSFSDYSSDLGDFEESPPPGYDPSDFTEDIMFEDNPLGLKDSLFEFCSGVDFNPMRGGW